MNEIKLTASQLEALRSMDSALTNLSTYTRKPIGTLRQVTFILTRTRKETGEAASAYVRLKGKIPYFQKGEIVLIDVEAVLELEEVGNLWWKLSRASIMFDLQHYHLSNCEILASNGKLYSHIERWSLDQFPR